MYLHEYIQIANKRKRWWQRKYSVEKLDMFSADELLEQIVADLQPESLVQYYESGLLPEMMGMLISARTEILAMGYKQLPKLKKD